MPTSTIDASQRKALRTAGWMYLFMTVSAPIGLLYVPGALIVQGDATATADNIRTSEWLLRIGIGSELFHQAVAVFLVLALYRLFRSVDENQAKLLVALGALVPVPIMFVNVLNEIAALILVSGADFLSGFDKSQLDALAFLFMQLHGQGFEVAAIFWGLWLFPFGILVMRSGFVPRFLGILLFFAGSANLVSSFTSLLVPRYEALVGQIAMVFAMAELPVVVWFLFRGVLPARWTEPGGASGQSAARP